MPLDPQIDPAGQNSLAGQWQGLLGTPNYVSNGWACLPRPRRIYAA